MPTSYRAIEQEDGTFRIKGLPIFTLLDAGENGQGLGEVGEAWLYSALQHDQFRRSMNDYKATAHIGHHSRETARTTGVENVGFIELTHVGPCEYDGEATTALFADLIVNREAMDRIRLNKLPGRSPEVSKGFPEVRSLALLTSQPPHLKFAQLRSDNVVIEEFATTQDAAEAGCFAVAMFADLSVSIDSGKAEAKDEDAPPKSEGDTAPAETPDATPDEDDGDDEEKIDMAQIDALKTEIAALKDSMQSMSTTMQALVAQSAPDEESDPGGEPAATFSDAAEPAKFAALEGRLAGLEARISENDAAAKAESLARDAAKDLRDGGWLVNEQVESKLATFAAKGDDDLAAFVDAYKLTAKDRTPSLDDALHGETVDPEHTDTLAKFSDHDASAVLAASADFDRLSGALPGFKSTREDFIRSRLSTQTPAATA